jgi:hypothetical protein
VREAVWGRYPFLGEEGGEEDKGGKKAGCSPWRRVGIVGLGGIAALGGIAVGIAVLEDTEAGIVASALMGTALVEES